jgi:hypothetical protein
VKNLSGKTADALRHQSNYRIIWLVEIDADSPDVATTTIYYGSRKYTLGANTYTDEIAPNGLALGWVRARLGGGLSSVSSIGLQIRNEDGESDNMDTYFLENDEVRVYVIFSDGTEAAGDRVLLQKGVVDDLPFDIRRWMFDIIDGSDKDFSSMPKTRVDLVTYPFAPLGSYGKPIPVAFGALNNKPDDDAGGRTALAPCRTLNGFTFQYTSGEQNDSYGQPYQYYQRATRYAKISNYTPVGSTFTIDDSERVMRLAPVLPASTNDQTTWYNVGDGDAATTVAVGAAENLDVHIGGTPKLGTIQSAVVQINGTGTYGYTVLLGASAKFTDPAASGNTTITLTDAATDHADDWDFELYEVQIDGSADAVISQVYLEITYDDQLTQERSELSIYQAITGWEDRTTYLRDGAVISNSGAALVSAPHVLAAVLRGKTTMNLLSASVNLTAVTAAQIARSDWLPALSLSEEVDIDFLNEFCFQMAMHLFKDHNGEWKMVAQEKSTEPVHAFFGNTHIAVKNPTAGIDQWEPDLTFGRTSTRDLINEVALRYGLDRGTGEFGKLIVASGRSRATASDGVVVQGAPTDTGTLTSATSTFVADGVAVGDTIYVKGDKTYTVVTRTSETELAISAAIGTVNAGTGLTFHVGPNLSGEMLRSQNRYKTENALGIRQDSSTEIAGYTSDWIQDDATAQAFVDHITDWRSQRRITVEFATFLNAVDVELGDFCWFDHAWLPPSKRPFSIGTLTSGINATVTTADSANNGLLQVGDHLLLGGVEVVKVTAVTYSGTDFQFTRANANTVAVAHSAGATIKRLDLVRWEVVGVKVDVQKAQIRLQIQETPPAYTPTGTVVAAGFPDWDVATAEQRASAGWLTLLSGRVKDEDEYSAISYVGPDTGTY